MKWSNGIHRILCCICAVVVFFVVLFSVSGSYAEPGRQKVKVAFPLIVGFGSVKDGIYSGYLYDYLQEISHYTGWEYEYIVVDGGLDSQGPRLIKMLEDGKIDIMGGILRNRGSELSFDFPEYSAGSTYSILSVLADDQRYDDMRYSTFNNMRVGVYAKAQKRIGNMKKFFRNYDISPNIVEFSGEQEMSQALLDGKIDAVLSNDFRISEKERILARFSGEPYYFVTTKGNKEILNGLNSAMSKIHDTKPNFNSELDKKHFRLLQRNHFYLTKEEHHFVEQADPIRVAMTSNWEPLQAVDWQTGKASGVMKDVMDYIAAQSGLRFEIILSRTYAESLEKLAAGEVDIIAGVVGDDRLAAKYDFVLSTVIMPLQMLTVRNKSANISESGREILALPHGYIYPEPYPEENIRRYDSMEQCIEAVNNGEADFCYGNNLVIEYYTRDQFLDNIALVGSTGEHETLAIAFAKPVQAELLTVINKSLLSLSKGQLQGFIDKNTILGERRVSFKALIRSNPTIAISVILFVSVVIVAAVVYSAVNRIRHNRKAAMDNERYRLLSELSNEYIYEYDYALDVLNASDKLVHLCGCPAIIRDFLASVGHKDGLLGKAFVESLQKGDKVSEFPVNAEGNVMWVRNVCSTIVDEQKLPLRRIGKLLDITREKKEKEGLLKEAQQDSLTGIYNKGTVEQLIAEYLRDSVPKEQSLFVFFDIDNFKSVNDNFGHIFGDTVLRGVAEILQAHCSGGDVAGRVGGDEFVLFFRNIAVEDVEWRVESLMQSVRVTYEECGYVVGISMGVTLAFGGEDYLMMARRADLALYQAKKWGKNQYCFYTPELEQND